DQRAEPGAVSGRGAGAGVRVVRRRRGGLRRGRTGPGWAADPPGRPGRRLALGLLRQRPDRRGGDRARRATAAPRRPWTGVAAAAGRGRDAAAGYRRAAGARAGDRAAVARPDPVAVDRRWDRG